MYKLKAWRKQTSCRDEQKYYYYRRDKFKH